jgi:hypothetical protein
MLLVLAWAAVLTFVVAYWVRSSAPWLAAMLVLMIGVPLVLLVLVFGMASV